MKHLKNYLSILSMLAILSLIAFSSCVSDDGGEEIICEVSVVSGEGGVVEVSKTEVLSGEEVTLSAFPETDYSFVNWTVNGKEVSTDNPYTTTITATTQFKANFEKNIAPGVEYFTDFGNSTRTDEQRALTSITLEGQTITVNQPSSQGAAIYFDKTSEVITLEKIKIITSNLNWKGNWMHSFLYVDWNKDGEFTSDLGGYPPVPKENSELLSYSFYGTSGSVYSGYNIKGENISGDGRSVWQLPEFSIPQAISSGTYRARLKIDWNNIDANSVASNEDAPCVVDFMIKITELTIPIYSVQVEASEGGKAQVSKTQVVLGEQATFTATPQEGYYFVNWTLNGDVVSTDNPYTTTITATTQLKANFEKYSKYFTDFGNSTRTDEQRALTSITLEGQTITVNQPSSQGAAIYFDKTSEVITLEKIKIITSNLNWKGNWMHSFLYVDWNKDGEFTSDLGGYPPVPKENSELLSYSFYGTSGSVYSGYNIKGENISGDGRSVWQLPEFSIPQAISSGTYRARLKIDWNNIDANSVAAKEDAPCVVDFMIKIL